MELRLKKEKNNFFKSNLFLLLVLILLIFVSRATYSVYKKEKLSREILEEKREEFRELENREKVLSGEIEKLSTERGVEEEIREKFGFVKGDEGLIILVESEATTTAGEGSEDRNIFQKFFDFIF